ncbi:hypothetical protein WHR41_02791 [Cladosporium halotolerans]|uniref:DUF3500 domain-containing protein n=1 Tax=Cladosporium halotolerans TaxID=1052096 RepID=A0AB34KTZ7_9PEZI
MANTLADHNKIVEVSKNFRDYLIPLDHPRLHPNDRDARTHGKGVLGNEGIFLTPVARGWLQNYQSPYHGFTTDGTIRQNLWKADPKANGPTKEMVAAAENLFKVASTDEQKRFSYDMNAKEWRSWSNPEVIVVDSGVRIEDMQKVTRDAVHDLLKASLSPEGYGKVWTAMLTNAFLGELTTLKNVMNTDSYHFCFFGEPAADKPWGFNVFGHHLCLNVFSLNGEVVIGPFFVGAEPNIIDEGPDKGTKMLKKEEEAGLALMKSFSPEQQQKATLQGDIDDIEGDTMPAGRFNKADLRGLGGAHQDNRVIPFEGLCAKDMTASQRQALLEIVGIFNEILPAETKKMFLKRVEDHLDETYFAWIGPVNDETPFYYRVHSPIVMDEFDHHNGVWLANALPKKYHIHTIQRLPNRGDYGTALYDEWRAKQGVKGGEKQ